jgi:hypothetical protein
LRSADDRAVITLEVTLGRTDHTSEPIQNRRHLNQTSRRVRTSRYRRLGVSCRVGLEPRARIGVRLAVAMRLATWPSHDHILVYLVLRHSTRIRDCIRAAPIYQNLIVRTRTPLAQLLPVPAAALVSGLSTMIITSQRSALAPTAVT